MPVISFSEFKADEQKFFKLSVKEPVWVSIGGHLFAISVVSVEEQRKLLTQIYHGGVESGQVKENYDPGELHTTEEVARNLGIEFGDVPAALDRSGPT